MATKAKLTPKPKPRVTPQSITKAATKAKAKLPIVDEPKRLTEDELGRYRDLLDNRNRLTNALGGLQAEYEFQKNGILGEMNSVHDGLQALESELIGVYGKINLDTNTGVYTEIVEK